MMRGRHVALMEVPIGVAYWQLGDTLMLPHLDRQESQFSAVQQEHPLLTFAIALLVHFVVTGLSLPATTVLTLLYGIG